jgi:hypothetical protein
MWTLPPRERPPCRRPGSGWHGRGQGFDKLHRRLREFIPAVWDLVQKVAHGGIDGVDTYVGHGQPCLLCGAFSSSQ